MSPGSIYDDENFRYECVIEDRDREADKIAIALKITRWNFIF